MSRPVSHWSRALATWALAALLLVLTGCGGAPAVPAPAGTTLTAAASKETTYTGDVRRHPGFGSTALGNRRDVLVYLPPSYRRGNARYPVLYMHDGNNVFDAETAFGGREWEADETAERLIARDAIEELIIVAVANTPDRIDEYTWARGTVQGQPAGGNGARYARFLTRELKPFVDRTYRTRPGREDTAALGSSLGGLISFYLGRYHPDVFGKIGVMSPSFWWADRAAFQETPGLPRDLRVWLDVGTREAPEDPDNEMLRDTRQMHRELQGLGYRDGANLGYFEDEGAGHNEYFWARRFERPLRFLFGRRAA